MPLDGRALALGRDWVAAADRQLELARTACERRMFNEAVALAAAATERFLKATLTAASRAFAFTHNIDRLLAGQEDDVREAIAGILTPRLRQQLTDGGTVARYPGGPLYSPDECRLAVDAAGAARAAMCSIRPELFDNTPAL
jgi:HEPN domain-containing protein